MTTSHPALVSAWARRSFRAPGSPTPGGDDVRNPRSGARRSTGHRTSRTVASASSAPQTKAFPSGVAVHSYEPASAPATCRPEPGRRLPPQVVAVDVGVAHDEAGALVEA